MSIPEAPPKPLVTVTTVGGTAVEIRSDRHTVRVDEPEPVGRDTGPDPYELLLGALGSCTAITAQMYAERRGWPLRRAVVSLRHERRHADDCASTDGRCERIYRHVELEGDLDDAQRAKLIDIAGRCPVARTIKTAVEIVAE
jgi:putative redox protein